MNPDLGEHLWNRGAARKRVVVYPAYPRSIADAPGGTFDVSFAFYRDGDPLAGFIGTVNTKQPLAALRELCADPDTPVAVVGKLARKPVVGSSGERFRLIRGTVRRLNDTDETAS